MINMERRFINLNDDEKSVWTETELRKLRDDEEEEGVYVYDDFDEWLSKLDGDFEEIAKK